MNLKQTFLCVGLMCTATVCAMNEAPVMTQPSTFEQNATQLLEHLNTMNQACVKAVESTFFSKGQISNLQADIHDVYNDGMKAAHDDQKLEDFLKILVLMPTAIQGQIKNIMSQHRTNYLAIETWKSTEDALCNIQAYCQQVYKDIRNLLSQD